MDRSSGVECGPLPKWLPKCPPPPLLAPIGLSHSGRRRGPPERSRFSGRCTTSSSHWFLESELHQRFLEPRDKMSCCCCCCTLLVLLPSSPTWTHLLGYNGAIRPPPLTARFRIATASSEEEKGEGLRWGPRAERGRAFRGLCAFSGPWPPGLLRFVFERSGCRCCRRCCCFHAGVCSLVRAAGCCCCIHRVSD